MQIEIRDADAVVLRDVLDTWIGEVSAEIRHTDNPGVRDRLRDRRASVRRLLDQLGSEDRSAAS